MTRAIFISLAALMLSVSCSSPCTRAQAAELAAAEKGKACGVTPMQWGSARESRCEAGLQKCGAEDQRSVDSYSDCLQKLPVCVSDQSFTWNLQRVGCAQPLASVNAECLSALQ